MTRIDAHQHYWLVDRDDYHWMPADGPLRADYLPADLVPLNEAAGIDGTILVQAAQTDAETVFLLGLAEDESARILGVVGWTPLDDPRAGETIERLATHAKLAGLRPMLHDIADPDWIARAVAAETLRQIEATGLVFEVLSFTEHLPAAYEALERVPELPVAIDHLSKPRYADPDPRWFELMRAFAQRPGTLCKLSGMVTEIGPAWQVDDVRRCAEFVLETFGPERVMFGSDWPVCLKAATHAEVVSLAEQLTAGLSAAEREGVFGANAANFYNVRGPQSRA